MRLDLLLIELIFIPAKILGMILVPLLILYLIVPKMIRRTLNKIVATAVIVTTVILRSLTMLASLLSTPETTKKWWKSKTLIFNGLTIVGVGISWLLSYLTPYPLLVVSLVIVQAVINLILRFTTKKAIK